MFVAILTLLCAVLASSDDDASLRDLVLAGTPAGGLAMPRIGFGTCCRKAASGKPLITSTLAYLRLGGRLIDTAQRYQNHKDLAVAIRKGGVPRSQLWITSKVWTMDGMADRSRAGAAAQVDIILRELGVEYVDLLLLHGAKGNTDAQRVDQWRALIDAKAAGKVRHIGVSNYGREQIEQLRAATGVLPAANQLEYHPFVESHVHELVRSLRNVSYWHVCWRVHAP